MGSSIFRLLDAPRRPKRPPRPPRRGMIYPHRRPQDGPSRPQDGPRGPQDGPRGPQDGPKTAQEASKTAQEAPKTAPRGGPDAGPARKFRALGHRTPPGRPRRSQEAPNRPPRGPKRPPRVPKEALRGPKTAPKRLQTCFEEATERRTTRSQRTLQRPLAHNQARWRDRPKTTRSAAPC